MSTLIHPTALVSPGAQIGNNVHIGPFCSVAEGVIIGDNSRLFSHVVIDGRVEIGCNNQIYPFTSIGMPPQDLKYKGENTGVRIGDNNIIRENMTIHRASVSGDGWTEIGSNNFLMAYVHIAHDCKLGSDIVMANNATLGGHVVVEDCVVIGGLTPIHQFCRIGGYAMVGGGSSVALDIPPYVIAAGYRGKLYGLNLVGLKRRGFNKETIDLLKKAYKLLFQEHHLLKDALYKARTELPQSAEIERMLTFIENSKRGVCRKLGEEIQ